MLTRLRRCLKKKEGFTLIELVVVVIILGILAAALVPGVIGRVQTARVNRYNSDVDAIATAARMYYMDNNGWPADLTALESYGIETETEDPWGNKYTLTTSEGDLVIGSETDDSDIEDRTIKAPVT